MLWALYAQSTCLNTSRLTIPENFSQIAVWLGCAVTIKPVSPLGAHLQAAQARQFEEKHNIVKHPGGVEAGTGSPVCPP
jgi:hypothetical protein